jgi:hypothetical protein
MYKSVAELAQVLVNVRALSDAVSPRREVGRGALRAFDKAV